MSRTPLLLTLAAAACGTDADSADGPRPWSYPLDDTLRLTDGQVVATPNSYHLQPESSLEDWAYSMPTLREQLGLGVRGFELDFHQEAGGFPVYHVVALDDQSTCPDLDACLGELAAWSADNPGHFPLFVQLEPKDDAGGDPITDWDGLDDTLRNAGPPVFTPADLRGDHTTLAEAVAADGWPTLGALRGHVIFGMDDDGEHRDAYRARGEGVIFMDSAPGDPDAAFAVVNDPADPALPALLAAHFLTRVFADSATDEPSLRPALRDAAVASGAHHLSTDFPQGDGTEPAFVLPDGAPVRCAPLTAPSACTPEALEDPAFIVP